MIERVTLQHLPDSQQDSSEAFSNLHNVMEATDARLISKGWEFDTCPSCEQGFYRKSQGQMDSCGSYDCSEGYEFLDSPSKRSKSIGLADVMQRFTNIFGEHGFLSHPPVDVKNGAGNSIFIGNAGQIFDNHIFGGEPVIDTTPTTVLQPVIRLQMQNSIDTVDGFTTSFVNAGSEQLSASIDEHLETIDVWMDFMSGVKLFMGDFALKPKLEQGSWGTIRGIETYTLRFNYRGLEIGVGNYTLIPTRDGLSMPQSDLTFGLERIMWAINKNSHFYEVIGPFTYAVRGEDALMDAYRTATLMAASGVNPGTDEQGSKLRSLLQKYGGLDNEFNPDLVAFYHNWWSQFATFPNDVKSTTDILRAEANRQSIVRIQSILRKRGIQTPSGNTAGPIDSFVANLPGKTYDILREDLNKK